MSHVWRRYMPRSKMSHLLEVQKKEFSTLYFQVKQSDANGKIASYLQLTCTRKYILKKCISHIYQNKYILNKTIYIYIYVFQKKNIYIFQFRKPDAFAHDIVKLSTGSFYNDFVRVALSMSHVCRRYIPRSKMSHPLEVKKNDFSISYLNIYIV